MARKALILKYFPLSQALGTVLAHGQNVGNVRWSKGRLLSQDDIEHAAHAGVAELFAVRLESCDIDEDRAATALAQALTGPGISMLAPSHGRVNLVANQAGLFRAPSELINKINAVSEGITLGTLVDYARVKVGDIVATIKIIPYSVEEKILHKGLKISKSLSVMPFLEMKVDLFHTLLPGTSEKIVRKTHDVTLIRLNSINSNCILSENCDHSLRSLANLLSKPTHAKITLVVGASATVDRNDVIPAAIVAAGGYVERLGMPVDPGNLLILGYIGNRSVIGLPGCARSPKRNGFDWVLERLVTGIRVDSAMIAEMGSGGLLPETARPEPRAKRL